MVHMHKMNQANQTDVPWRDPMKLYQGDCLEVMPTLPDNSIDLTVTSPPYDNLRTYNNSLEWNEDIWKAIVRELYRVTKRGGVVVWIVCDATINGSETGTSFRQALYFKEIGFNLHDTMIWNKQNCSSIGSLNNYENTFEYMSVFGKGKIKTVNIIKDKVNKRAGELQSGKIRQKDGTIIKTTHYGKRRIADFGRRSNVWNIFPVKSKNEKFHPAQFPEQLAHDHIISWSNEGDTVLDPMMGSGTTGKMAYRLNRNFIGIEKVQEYFEIAKDRIRGMQHEVV
jgi:DNA modification methylase